MNFPAEAQLPWVTAVALAILVVETGLLLVLLAPRKPQKKAPVEELPKAFGVQLEKLEGHLSRLEEEQARFRSEVTQSLENLKRHKPQPPSRHFSSSGLDKKHYVLSLARKGLGTQDISRRLNIYPGEAELVIGLTKMRQLSKGPVIQESNRE